MNLVDIPVITLPPRPTPDSHSRQPCRERQSVTADGTYRDGVPAASSDPRVVMFGAFIKRAMSEARASGLDVKAVEARTGVKQATIYRWIRAENPNPQREKVLAFCEGLGIPVHLAAQILGWDGSRQPTTPDPTVDPDIHRIMRKLNDPAVPEAEKITIRATLRHLAKE